MLELILSLSLQIGVADTAGVPGDDACTPRIYALCSDCFDVSRRYEKKWVVAAHGIRIIGNGYSKPAMAPVIWVVMNLEGLGHGLQIGDFDLHNVIVGVVDKITISQGANGTISFRCSNKGVLR